MVALVRHRGGPLLGCVGVRVGYYAANLIRFLVAGSLLIWIVMFSVYAYPHIPFSLGGGQPRDVVFVLSASQVAPFLVRDGAGPRTVPYKLLRENEQSFVVLSPNDGQTAIEFDRKAVAAMIVLGKRPKLP